MGGKAQTNRAINPRNLLDHGHILNVPHSRAPILLREKDSEEPQLSQLLHKIHSKVLCLIPLQTVRSNLRLRKLPGETLNLLLLLSQIKIQSRPLSPVATQLLTRLSQKTF